MIVDRQRHRNDGPDRIAGAAPEESTFALPAMGPHIGLCDPEQVESENVGPFASEHEPGEIRSAVLVQRNQVAVDDSCFSKVKIDLLYTTLNDFLKRS